MSAVRTWPGQRLARITARTIHIGAACLVLGAATFGAPASNTRVGLLLLSGLFILADDLYRNGPALFRYLQFWAALAKILLVTLGTAVPSLLLPCLWAALIVGSAISHAPGHIRHYELWSASPSSD